MPNASRHIHFSHLSLSDTCFFPASGISSHRLYSPSLTTRPHLLPLRAMNLTRTLLARLRTARLGQRHKIITFASSLVCSFDPYSLLRLRPCKYVVSFTSSPFILCSWTVYFSCLGHTSTRDTEFTGLDRQVPCLPFSPSTFFDAMDVLIQC